MDESKNETQAATTLMVSRQFRQGGEDGALDEHEESLEVRRFLVPPAEVGVSRGLTISLPKKFEFARLDVSVKVPCYYEELDAAYEHAASFCESRLEAEVAKVRGTPSPKAESIF